VAIPIVWKSADLPCAESVWKATDLDCMSRLFHLVAISVNYISIAVSKLDT